MRVAIYARVSTQDQTCQMQTTALREFAAQRKWETVSEYVDTGWSGKASSRPELNHLMRDAADRQFDVVIVWKLDRFGRSVINLVESIDRLTKYGIRFMAITQGIDTDETNPVARFILVVLGAVGEFERSLIIERTVAGMKTAKAKGIHCGRKRVVVDRERAKMLQREGLSIRDIAKKFKIGRGTVARALAGTGKAG